MNNTDNFNSNIAGPSLNNIVNENDIYSEEEPNILQHSPYVNFKGLIDILTTKNEVFKCLSINIQCLNAKFDSLQVYIQHLRDNGCHFEAICLQETWIREESSLSLFQLEDYTLISQPYRCSSHAGLAIYLKKDIQYTIIDTVDSASNTWEGQFIKVKLSSNTNVTLGNIYRPPRENRENYENFFTELEPIISSLQGEVIVSGDYNIDLLKIQTKQTSSDFFEKMLSMGYIPKITLPTRLTHNNGTLIDNHFCKLSNNFSDTTSGIIISNLSDHLPYFTCLDYLKIKQSTPKYVKYRIQNSDAHANLKMFIQSQDICSKLDNSPNANPETNYDILNRIIQTGLDTYLPFKTTKYNKHKHKGSSWITMGIVRSIKFRDKLYTKLRNTPITNNQVHCQLQTNLKTYNKILKRLIKEAKQTYYETKFNHYKSDIKKTWVTIKDIINKTKNKHTITNFFRVENRNITDKVEISNQFNRFFTEIGPQLASNIPMVTNKTFETYLTSSHHKNFEFSLVDDLDIIRIINRLQSKSSYGYDNLSTKLLKYLKHDLCKPLAVIINQTLISGTFPSQLKIAKVIPVYKKDDPTLLTNYRPISVLPSISKVFEKSIFNQLHTFFKNNKLYFNSQYGFREAHSTEHATIELIDRLIFEMDKGNTPITVFMDLSKAFDTIDHKILLHKLEYYGIRGQALNLFKSYLTDRKQFVMYEDTASGYQNVKTGVPQGSILGPLLFIIYINDLCVSTAEFDFISYADDTTLFLSFNMSETELATTAECLMNNLEKVNDWLKLNKLSLNISKTKCMVFHTPQKRVQKPEISICNESIEYVSDFNFLGIVINENLNWKSHISTISKKISKTIGIINRLKTTLPQHVLLILYNSLINSYLNYGALCWGFKSDHLIKLQKKATRIITNSKYNAHTDPLFKKLRILKMNDIITRKLYKFYYRYKKDNLPYYFTYNFLKRNEHLYGTRNESFITPRTHHKFTENCVRYQLPYLLNQHENAILNKVDTHSEYGFSLYIKNINIQKYTDTCNRNNCFICSRPS